METRVPLWENFPTGVEAALPETDLYLRTLRRAAEVMGDQDALARRLRVTPSHLALWIQGIESPPTYVFLRAVDLISEREFPQKPS